MSHVTLDQYKGTEIEKGFKRRDVEKAIVVAIDNFEKAEGKKCSPKMRSCINDVMKQGKSEGSAIAICKVSVGE